MDPFSRKFVVLSYQKISDEAIAQKIFFNFKMLGKSNEMPLQADCWIPAHLMWEKCIDQSTFRLLKER
jgi:hypothetical protein